MAGKSKTVTRRLPFLVFAPSPVGEGRGEGTSPQELTQAQLENQRFSFTGKNKVDIQTHTF